MNDYGLEYRKFVVAGVAIVIVVVYILRLFTLQLMSDDYKKTADSNAFLRKIDYPSRGVITDRNGNLLVYMVIGITAGESYTTEVVRADTREIVVNTVAEIIELLGRHATFHTLADVVVINILPNDRHAVGADDTQERLVFIAPRLGNDEGDMHVLLLRHAAGETVTGGT